MSQNIIIDREFCSVAEHDKRKFHAMVAWRSEDLRNSESKSLR